MLHKLWTKKVVRFAFVGGLNTIIDFTIFNTLSDGFHINPVAANTVSAAVSISVSYFLNHYIVFRHNQPHSFVRFAKFIMVTGISVIGIQNTVIEMVRLTANHTSINQHATAHLFGVGIGATIIINNIGKLLAVIIGMVWNYVLYNKILFKEKPVEAEVLI